MINETENKNNLETLKNIEKDTILSEYLEIYPFSDYYFDEENDVDLEKCIPTCQIKKRILSLTDKKAQ